LSLKWENKFVNRTDSEKRTQIERVREQRGEENIWTSGKRNADSMAVLS
jgi:hypothetical protein